MEMKPSHVEMVTVQATAGMVAGACSSVITTPIDTVKTRLQVFKTFVSWTLHSINQFWMWRLKFVHRLWTIMVREDHQY